MECIYLIKLDIYFLWVAVVRETYVCVLKCRACLIEKKEDAERPEQRPRMRSIVYSSLTGC